MPIATKTQKSLLTEDFKNQIAGNLSINGPSPVGRAAPQAVSAGTPPETVPEKPRGKYDDVANLHFSRGKKAEFRAFFSAHGVTLVQGVENAVSYIMKEVRAGRLKVSRNGIETVGEQV